MIFPRIGSVFVVFLERIARDSLAFDKFFPALTSRLLPIAFSV